MSCHQTNATIIDQVTIFFGDICVCWEHPVRDVILQVIHVVLELVRLICYVPEHSTDILWVKCRKCKLRESAPFHDVTSDDWVLIIDE